MASLLSIRWPKSSLHSASRRRRRDTRGKGNSLRPEAERFEERVLLFAGGFGLATSTSANIPLSYGAWTTVDSLNVTVDASKTGLYDLAFGATAGMLGNSYDYFRVWVDGSPYDPNDLIATSNNNYTSAFNYQAIAFSRQLTLAAGAHQVQVQAWSPTAPPTTFSPTPSSSSPATVRSGRRPRPMAWRRARARTSP